MRVRYALTVLATGATIAGCAGTKQPTGAACPRPGILEGLESDTVFRGGAKSGPANDLTYTAGMQNIGGGCHYDKNGLVVDLSIDILVEKGPAASEGPINIPWFIAVAGPDGTILDRQDYTAAVPIAAGAESGGSRETVQQTYAGVGEQTGAAYRIYLGLAVDRAEALRRRAKVP